MLALSKMVLESRDFDFWTNLLKGIFDYCKHIWYLLKKIASINSLMGRDTNKLTSLRPLYMGIIENVAPKRST